MVNYKRKIMPLDIIIIYNKKSFLHKLIHGVTGYRAGHVALYMGNEMISEATKSGIHRKKWKNYSRNCNIYLARFLQLSETQELKIRQYVYECENQKYSFLQLLAILLMYIFKLKKIPDVSKKAQICSEFVAMSFMRAGINLCNKSPHATVPGDLLKSNILSIIKC